MEHIRGQYTGIYGDRGYTVTVPVYSKPKIFEEMQVQIFWRGERDSESMRAWPTLPAHVNPFAEKS